MISPPKISPKELILKFIKINKVFFKQRKERVRERFKKNLLESIPLELLFIMQLCFWFASGHNKTLDHDLTIASNACGKMIAIYIIILALTAYFKELDIYFDDAEKNNWHAPES